MADGAVNFLLDKITTILLQEASFLGDAHNQIEEIKLELESMRSFLRDAERRREKSEQVETWVSQVREVAYEVEDILDEFMHHRDKGQHRNGLNSFVQVIVKLPKSIAARHHIASKLQGIKAKVHEISERSKRYGFDVIDEGKRENAAPDRWQHHRELSVFIDEDEIVGMEENRERLLQWLMEEEPRRTVISVVGMGGLGKTTLVTKVYNDQTIKRQFDCWAWISVSQTFVVEELLVSMIKEFSEITQMMVPSNLGSMKYMQLVGMLIDHLHHKRYVVVLDDIWSIDLWSKVRGAFPKNKFGSRIILTTRNENVATSVGIGSRIHHLKPLRENDAWSLFCKKAFWSDPDHSCPMELEGLARIIMKKCEGLPLALVAIGSLMSSRNKTVVEWKKVYESLNWQLNNNPMLEQVKAILLMSFNDLPFYLKHCFLYCCVFRDGYPIKRKKLIRLWVAEGFIIERKGMTMEEAAEDYLTDLIFRSMIQVTETNDAGRVKSCRVHDVMRELAMTTCEREKFCTVYDGRESKLEGRIHRLSVYNRGENLRLSGTMSHHLRSFFVFETDTCWSFSFNAVSPKFRLLRVLDLQGVSIETIPSALVGLFNLRYMSLRDTKIRELPEPMERLKSLQTLDVRNTYVEKLPRGISKLPKLRHLYMYRCNDQISGTYNIPRSIQAPVGIWNVQSLRTLVCIEAEEQLIKQVGSLIELRRLEITGLKAVDGPKLCTSIQKMKSLVHLGVIASTEEEELRLEAIQLPPSFLQKLTLVGQLNCLPHWLDSLSNLTHLYLGWSQLGSDVISSLHGLSSLVLLELRKAYDGKLLHFEAGWFPKLNKLVLRELTYLCNVTVEEAALKSIREFYLICCWELKVLPQGIEHLSGLQKLHLEGMSEELVQGLQSETSEDRARTKHITIVNHVSREQLQ